MNRKVTSYNREPGEASKLTALDVSRTSIDHIAVSRLLNSSQNLKVACVLNYLFVERDLSFWSDIFKRKVLNCLLIAIVNNSLNWLASLFDDHLKMPKDIFSYWVGLISKDKSIGETMRWIEWIISHMLLRMEKSNPQGLKNFWLDQGAKLLHRLMQSSQEDAQESAATCVATFIVVDDENARVDCERAEAVMRDGGIRLLIKLARSCRQGIQSEAAKAIGNLLVNVNVAKALAKGGIDVLVGLAKSIE